MKETKHLEWIDLLKGITILLVIVGHTIPEKSTIWILIYSFHIPLFFIISGYTFKKVEKEKLFTYFFHDVKRILLPVVVLRFISCLIGVGYKRYDLQTGLVDMLRRIKWAMVDDATVKYFSFPEIKAPGIGILWFLMALFVAKTIYRFLLYIPAKYRVVIIFAGLMANMYMGYMKILLPLTLNIVFLVMTFMEFGYELNEYDVVSKSLPRWIYVILTAAWLTATLIFVIYIQIAGNIYKCGLVCIINALVGSYMIIKVANAYCRSKISIRPIERILLIVGVNSMELYAIHFFDGYWMNLWALSPFGNEMLNMVVLTVMRIAVDSLFLYICVKANNLFKNGIVTYTN